MHINLTLPFVIRLKFKIIFLICAFTSSTFAYTPEEGNITANLSPFIYKTNFEGSPTGASSPTMGGLGLIVGGDINEKGALELAVFHMNKIFVRDMNGMYLSESTEAIQINMGYRRWITDYLAVSLTFYSAYSMNKPQVVHTDFPANSDFGTSAQDTTEYGFDLSLQGEVWTQGKYAVVVDGRYSRSVTPKDNEHADHYGVLVGLRYLIQEKFQDTTDSKK